MRIQLIDSDGGRAKSGDASLLEAFESGRGQRIWLDLGAEDGMSERMLLGETLQLHELALEDAFRDRHPPKTERFGETQFIIMRELTAQNMEGEVPRIGVSLFVSEDMLVTRATSASALLESFWTRVQREPELLRNPIDLCIELLNRLVRGYSELLLGVESRLNELGSEIFASPKDSQLVELTGYKSKLNQLRMVSVQHEQVLEELAGCACFGEDRSHQLQNVTDHVRRSVNLATLYYDTASDLIDSYLAFASHRMNQVMKVLTIFTVIFVPLSFLAGIYGMNFEHMPELHVAHGYYVLLGLMVSIVAAQLVVFWRKGWF